MVNSWTRLRLRFLADSPLAQRNDTRRKTTRTPLKERLNVGSTLLREPPCNRCIIISIKILDRISGIDQGRKSSARNVGNSQAERRTKGDGKEGKVFIAERSIDLFAKSFSNVSTDKMDILSCLRFSAALRSLGKGRSCEISSSCPRAVCVNDSIEV